MEYNIEHLTEYTIKWFEYLKNKYGEKYPRRTEIRNFETIVATKVVEANEKLYINREEGFIGTALKKDEFVCNCSDIDDIIVFFKDGRYKIVKVADKLFVGTNVIHIDVFRKNDKRTVYNIVYRDGKGGEYYMKRCAVYGVSRDKDYDLTQGKPGSKIVYFTANSNGEAEVIRVVLKPNIRLKKTVLEKDLSTLAIKGRQSRGNLLTKYDVLRITLKQKGGSTLGGRKVWFDPDVMRINYDGRGSYLGEFFNEDAVLVINRNGEYYTTTFDSSNHFQGDLVHVIKYNPDTVWSVVLWDADQKYYYLKRFQLEPTSKPVNFLGDNPASYMVLLMSDEYPRIRVVFGGNDAAREPLTIHVDEFIAVKSCKAKGKRITTYQVEKVEELEPYKPVAEATDDADDDSVDLEESTKENESVEQGDEMSDDEISQEEYLEQEEQPSEGIVEPTQKEQTQTSQEDVGTSTPKDGIEEAPNPEVKEIKMEIVAEIPEDSLPINANQDVQQRKRKSARNSNKTEGEEGQMSLF